MRPVKNKVICMNAQSCMDECTHQTLHEKTEDCPSGGRDCGQCIEWGVPHSVAIDDDGNKYLIPISGTEEDRPHTPAPEQCAYWGMKDGKPVCSLLIPDPALYVELTNAIKAEAARAATLAVLPTERELESIKQAVCHALNDRIDGFELADNYYHKLKSLRITGAGKP